MSDESAFRRMEETERVYAPEQLPAEEQDRVLADEQRGPHTLPDGTAIPSSDAGTPEAETPEPGAVQVFNFGQGFGLQK